MYHVVNVSAPAENGFGDYYYSDARETASVTGLRKEIRTIIDAEHKMFGHRILDDLPEFVRRFLHKDLLTNIDRHWNTVHRRRLSVLIKKLFAEFNATQNNIVYLSGWLMCVFHNIAEKSPILPEEMKFKLTGFIDSVAKLVNDFDGAMWKRWFACDGLYTDWFFFVATLFVPNVGDKSTVENAAKYFEIVKNLRYTCSLYDNCPNVDISEILNNCTDPLSKDRNRNYDKQRKFEEYGCGVEGKQTERRRRNAKASAASDDEKPSLETQGQSKRQIPEAQDKPVARKRIKRGKLFKKLLRKTILANRCYQM